MTAALSSSSLSAEQRLVTFAREIRISHTIFAMPFALLSTFLAAGRAPRIGELMLIVLCMIAARTVAMSANRLLDAELDAKNPRTAGRAIPSGKLSRGFMVGAVLTCSFVFVSFTAMFGTFYKNWLPLALAIPVLLFLMVYPLLKRFTRLCHYYLGAALGLAPICAWIGIRGNVALIPVIMGAAVLCWTAGFDIIYACQDFQSDLETGVVSVPAKLGIGGALWLSRATHLISLALLILLGLVSNGLGALYFIGVFCAGALLVIEHMMVTPRDLSKANIAFFTMNGIISVVLGTLGICDVLLKK